MTEKSKYLFFALGMVDFIVTVASHFYRTVAKNRNMFQFKKFNWLKIEKSNEASNPDQTLLTPWLNSHGGPSPPHC